MIPEEKKDAVKRALELTFDVSEFDEITLLTAGLSTALIYKMVIKGKSYLLRIITLTNAMSDPAHWYGNMQKGAQAGIAPRVWYAGLEDRIAITDYIEGKPFPIGKAKIELANLLKRLHTLPPFPFRLNYLDAVNGFVKKFREMKIMPENMTTEIFNTYEQITAVYPRDISDWVSCHNDLKPENILFDGHQAWLVDWEAAFLNDRYMDLSIIANFVITNQEDEDDVLKTYFGDDLNEYHKARFYLARQIMHVAYFTVFMQIAAATGNAIDLEEVKPNFRTFHDDIWAGKISLKDVKRKEQYAWAHLQQLQYNFQQPRLKESMRIVADYHSC